MKAKRQLYLLLLGLCAVSAAGAAQPPPSPPEGLDLGEAIRLTLENDPNIALTEARLAGARGALLGAADQFDPVLTSRVDQVASNTPQLGGGSREERSLESSLRWNP